MVDRRYHCFISKKTGRMLKTTEEHMISLQEWRIAPEKISVNTLTESPDEATGEHICKGALYNSPRNGEIHPSTDES